MSKQIVDKKNYLPMFFYLNLVSPSLGLSPDNIVNTAVSIDFNSGVICFLNPKTPVYAAREYVRMLPDFFNIRAICIGMDDFDETILSLFDHED